MTDILLDKYPTPWKVCNEAWAENPHIRDANDTFILGVASYDIDIIKFVAETVNNSVLPRITDAPCECSFCSWQGIVQDCMPDVNSEGDLRCPRCQSVIEVIA